MRYRIQRSRHRIVNTRCIVYLHVLPAAFLPTMHSTTGLHKNRKSIDDSGCTFLFYALNGLRNGRRPLVVADLQVDLQCLTSCPSRDWEKDVSMQASSSSTSYQSATTLHQIDGEPFRARQGRVHRVRAAKRGIPACFSKKSKRAPEDMYGQNGRRAGGVVTRSAARSCFRKTTSHHARFPWFDACQIGQEQNLQVEERTKKVFPF